MKLLESDTAQNTRVQTKSATTFPAPRTSVIRFGPRHLQNPEFKARILDRTNVAGRLRGDLRKKGGDETPQAMDSMFLGKVT